MKLYRADRAGILAGIRLTKQETLGWVIALGEPGRGRWLECIKLDGKKPPVVAAVDDQKLVYEADLFSFDTGTRKRHSLVAQDDPSDSRFLVEISTGPDCIRGCQGDTDGISGKPAKVAVGKGALGENGKLGAWEHSLWIMKDGDVVMVSPAGNDDAYVVLFVSGALSKMPTKEFRLISSSKFQA